MASIEERRLVSSLAAPFESVIVHDPSRREAGGPRAGVAARV